MNEKKNIFDFAAQVGLTKQLGGLKATDDLVALCHIDSTSEVLDVGCGAGVTPCYLTKKIGCTVVGVDILDGMIEWSKKQAERQGVTDRTTFRLADAQELPFGDNRFDAVITESVTAFPNDQRKALQEYVRVTKPGGYVGMTEMTWLKPPSPALEQAFKKMVFAQALDASGWTDLMEGAGLIDVVGNAHRIDVASESKGRFERYGRWSIVKAMPKMLVMFLSDRRSRR